MQILRRAISRCGLFLIDASRRSSTSCSPLEGRLRADALKGPSGVTLDVLVDRIELDGFAARHDGGALIGVGGELAGDRILQWRARPPRRISCHASDTDDVSRPGRRRRGAAAGVARCRARGVGQERQARRRHRPRAHGSRKRLRRPARRFGRRSRRAWRHGARDRRQSSPRF